MSDTAIPISQRNGHEYEIDGQIKRTVHFGRGQAPTAYTFLTEQELAEHRSNIVITRVHTCQFPLERTNNIYQRFIFCDAPVAPERVYCPEHVELCYFKKTAARISVLVARPHNNNSEAEPNLSEIDLSLADTEAAPTADQEADQDILIRDDEENDNDSGISVNSWREESY